MGVNFLAVGFLPVADGRAKEGAMATPGTSGCSSDKLSPSWARE